MTIADELPCPRLVLDSEEGRRLRGMQLQRQLRIPLEAGQCAPSRLTKNRRGSKTSGGSVEDEDEDEDRRENQQRTKSGVLGRDVDAVALRPGGLHDVDISNICMQDTKAIRSGVGRDLVPHTAPIPSG